MTTPIGTVGTPTTTATTSATRNDQMGKDTFLKLLVAQMRYQDPSNPTSSSEFMAQTATFTQVEKLEEIASQNRELLTLQRSLSAGALVGKHVAYTADDGTTVTGAVSSVVVTSGSEPRAIVGDKAVPLGRITEITLPEVDAPATGTPAS
ncbi:flagellar hook assembly protein FlgD [Modestobacter versicolor]|uniref:Flagellar basal-body rod modification protein FlgD n=1 Tax=Modestobacter versicolor TaxID=429133 RepID=A0A323V6A1_9ACTN|nr:flagellar hook capping FlgD N-terminal domain-containing protein [Modestobacter versicolor]MBB3676520.1 flagellar basal-body rod modification protein FlgD [Modestobacter versicolor]PZA20051.1 flagellar hook capping protein [Modestobacter versicolor]